jgi:integrase/recombinase XerD
MELETSSVDQFYRFENFLVGEGRSKHTLIAYRRDLTLFDRWFTVSNGKPLTPDTITPIDVRQYRSYLLTVQERKPATVNRRLASLSAFCSWARTAGLISANPVDGIAQVKETRPAPKWLEKNQQYALLRAVQEKGRARDVALVTLMLHTGLRVSEVSALKMEDLELSDRKGSVTVRGGKGGKYRIVPLNADVRESLELYFKKREAAIPGDYLFIGQRGSKLESPGIYYLIQSYAYNAHLEDVTPHTLRHSFGKNLVDAGVSIDRVAQLLGHESVDTTRIYTTPSEQDLQRDVEKIGLLYG